MYDTILGRSFSRHDQKKLGYGAFLGCFIILLSFCSLLKHLGPLPFLNLSLSSGKGLRMLVMGETNMTRQSGVENLRIDESNGNGTAFWQEVRDYGIGETTTKKTKTNSSASQSVTYKVLMRHEHDFESKKTNYVSNVVVDSQVEEAKAVKVGTNTTSHQIVTTETNTTHTPFSFSCNTTQPRSDFCELTGDIRLRPNSPTLFIVTPKTPNIPTTLKPYARKEDTSAMSHVREWSLKPTTTKDSPKCGVNHAVPAVLFSSGGYSGNHFHAFSDVIIPLYITSVGFNRQVQFLITNGYPRWAHKFREILRGLSEFEVIDVDSTQQVHCFPTVTVGLKHHKELGIDSSRSNLSMTGFRQFLRSTYSLKRAIAMENSQHKPRLLLISRKFSRSFTNSASIAKLGRSLGFEVIVSEADIKLPTFAELVNTCDVLVGVHGAGLANMLFLPENAVVIQVVPLGKMTWLAKTYFQVPAKEMNLRYLEYDIRERESTLVEQYAKGDVVLKDPSVVMKRGWEAFKAVYLEKQNVKLDVRRFKPTLLKALALLRSHRL